MAFVLYLRNVLLDKSKRNVLFESTLLAKLLSISTPSIYKILHHVRIVFCNSASHLSMVAIADALEPLANNLDEFDQVLCFQYVAIEGGTAVAQQVEIFASYFVKTPESI